MVTNYGTHLTIWSLLENKKIVSLSCRSELLSVLFSANDRFIGTTSINQLCVYDTANSYSMVSRSTSSDAMLISTSYSDSWYVSDRKLEIVKYDLTIKPTSEGFVSVCPANARAAAKFQAVMEGDDDSWFHKIGSCDFTFFILSNKCVLVYKHFRREIKLFRLTELIQNSNKKKQGIKFIFSLLGMRRFYVSLDGSYIYASKRFFPNEFLFVKLSWPRSVKSITIFDYTIYSGMASTSFVPGTNGVFFRGEIRKSSAGENKLCAGIPELWNSGVTQRLASFPELTGTYYCLSVSRDLVACIMESQVCFFNVVKKAIVARTPFPEHFSILLREGGIGKIGVIACSSLFHMLIRYKRSAYLLQYANSVDLNSCVFNNIMPEVVSYIIAACFSPDGQSLAILDWDTLYILDVATLNIRGKFFLYSRMEFPNDECKLEYVDEEHLLCEGYNNCLCLINVKSCYILSCISLSLDFNPWGIFACRNTVGIIVYNHEYGKFKLIKLWLPQQRNDGNELLECSCWIHGGNINDPPNPTEISTARSRCSII